MRRITGGWSVECGRLEIAVERRLEALPWEWFARWEEGGWSLWIPLPGRRQIAVGWFYDMPEDDER